MSSETEVTPIDRVEIWSDLNRGICTEDLSVDEVLNQFQL